MIQNQEIVLFDEIQQYFQKIRKYDDKQLFQLMEKIQDCEDLLITIFFHKLKESIIIISEDFVNFYFKIQNQACPIFKLYFIDYLIYQGYENFKEEFLHLHFIVACSIRAQNFFRQEVIKFSKSKYYLELVKRFLNETEEYSVNGIFIILQLNKQQLQVIPQDVRIKILRYLEDVVENLKIGSLSSIKYQFKDLFFDFINFLIQYKQELVVSPYLIKSIEKLTLVFGSFSDFKEINEFKRMLNNDNTYLDYNKFFEQYDLSKQLQSQICQNYRKNLQIILDYNTRLNYSILDQQTEDKIKSIIKNIKNSKIQTRDVYKNYFLDFSLDDVNQNKELLNALQDYINSDDQSLRQKFLQYLNTSQYFLLGNYLGCYVEQLDSDNICQNLQKFSVLYDKFKKNKQVQNMHIFLKIIEFKIRIAEQNDQKLIIYFKNKFINENLTINNILYKDMWELYNNEDFSFTNNLYIPKDLLNTNFIPKISLQSRLNKKQIEGFIHMQNLTQKLNEINITILSEKQVKDRKKIDLKDNYLYKVQLSNETNKKAKIDLLIGPQYSINIVIFDFEVNQFFTRYYK